MSNLLSFYALKNDGALFTLPVAEDTGHALAQYEKDCAAKGIERENFRVLLSEQGLSNLMEELKAAVENHGPILHWFAVPVSEPEKPLPSPYGENQESFQAMLSNLTRAGFETIGPIKVPTAMNEWAALVNRSEEPQRD